MNRAQRSKNPQNTPPAQKSRYAPPPSKSQAKPQPTPTVSFPIDLVYTWVDGSDEELITLRNQYIAETVVAEDSKNPCRWRDLDELKYSIESVNMFAPWIRTIYVISDHQRPHWFEENNPGKVVFIDHPELYGEFDEHLPTFNSHSIESHLHRIPNLAEHFIYANDDTFIGDFVTPLDFFTPEGKFKVFLSTVEMPNEPITDMVPYIAAQINVNHLLEDAGFGNHTKFQLKHQMKPLTKTALNYCWENERLMLYLFNTSSNRFRDHSDIDPLALVSHVGLVTQQAIEGQITSKYYLFNDDSDLKKIFMHLYRWRPLSKLYCLNDNMSYPSQKRLQRIHMGFQKYLPHKFLSK